MAHQEQDKIDSLLILQNTHTHTSQASKFLPGNDYPTLVSSSRKKKNDAFSSSTHQLAAGEISGKQVMEIIIK